MRRLIFAGVFLMLAGASARPVLGQPAADEVRRGYELLYGGDRQEAFRYFERQSGPRPGDLPLGLGLLLALSERVDRNPSLQPDFERRMDAFIDRADQRLSRNRNDAEAQFHLAQGYMLRARYRFEHDKGMWGAARDGAKAKSYSDAYVKAHPEHADAYLTLGLYNYYVELIPTFFKALRFLMFLPAGNRVEGLKQIERAAAGGTLLGPMAQSALVEIYARFEGRTADALAVGDRLQRRYPTNDEFVFLLAGVWSGPGVEDRERAAAAYQQVADRRRADVSLDGAASHHSALLSLASVRVDQWRLDDAIAVLTPVIDARVAPQDWILPQFLLRRANYRALVLDPGAGDDIRRVQADPTMARFHASAASMLKWLSARPAPEATTYAALIPGNRLTAEGRWDDARRAYEPVRARSPEDPQVRLRLGQLTFARGDAEQTLPLLSAVVAAGKAAPGWIRATALLYMARVHDLAGRRDQARALYQQIVDDYETERPAQAARLGLLTPYRRVGA